MLAPLSLPIVLSTNVNENRLGKRRITSATKICIQSKQELFVSLKPLIGFDCLVFVC